jgi:hypothetical protein
LFLFPPAISPVGDRKLVDTRDQFVNRIRLESIFHVDHSTPTFEGRGRIVEAESSRIIASKARRRQAKWGYNRGWYGIEKLGFRRDMLRQLSIALLLVTASVPLATAQRHGGFARGGARGTRQHSGTHRFNQGIFPGVPYFYSDYDPIGPYGSDNSFESAVQGYGEGVPGQFVVVRRASADDSPRNTKPRPLLIELQGDRYVRFGGAQETEVRVTSAHPYDEAPASAEPPSSAAHRDHAEAQAAELPPAVLVYRDGHREEIAGYAIADGVIYIRANDWQNGDWTRHIPLATLDSAATLEANRQRGAKFMLPSASNVVIASF